VQHAVGRMACVEATLCLGTGPRAGGGVCYAPGGIESARLDGCGVSNRSGVVVARARQG